MQQAMRSVCTIDSGAFAARELFVAEGAAVLKLKIRVKSRG